MGLAGKAEKAEAETVTRVAQEGGGTKVHDAWDKRIAGAGGASVTLFAST